MYLMELKPFFINTIYTDQLKGVVLNLANSDELTNELMNRPPAEEEALCYTCEK